MKDREWTSFFIGVPLPVRYQNNFEKVLIDLNKVVPDLSLVSSQTPHITLFYLLNHAQDFIPDIFSRVSRYRSVISKTPLNIGGMGIFGGDIPRTLFLNVSSPPSLESFHKLISDELYEFSAKDNVEGFIPHLTVARLTTSRAIQSFRQNQKVIGDLFADTRMNFMINELGLYAVDSNLTPEYQEVLRKIPIRV